MPFINVDLNDAREQETVPEGNYKLRIVKAEDGESKAGNEMTTVYIKIENSDVPNPALIRHWITYPGRDSTADQRAMRLIDIKRFLVCFGIPFEGGGFNSEDLVGAEGECLVITETGDDGNDYNRLRLPRLKKAEQGEALHGEENRRRRR